MGRSLDQKISGGARFSSAPADVTLCYLFSEMPVFRGVRVRSKKCQEIYKEAVVLCERKLKSTNHTVILRIRLIQQTMWSKSSMLYFLKEIIVQTFLLIEYLFF